MRNDQEAWQSVIAGSISLRRLDHRGEMTRTEIINGGQMLHITPEERRLNEEKAVSDSYNVFRNGSLVPVRLLDGTEDAREIASNPNLLSASDLEALLHLPSDGFERRLGDITNVATLNRLVLLAEKDPEVAHRKIQVLNARLEELRPRTHVEVAAPSGGSPSGGAPAFRPVTPR